MFVRQPLHSCRLLERKRQPCQSRSYAHRVAPAIASHGTQQRQDSLRRLEPTSERSIRECTASLRGTDPRKDLDSVTIPSFPHEERTHESICKPAHLDGNSLLYQPGGESQS